MWIWRLRRLQLREKGEVSAPGLAFMFVRLPSLTVVLMSCQINGNLPSYSP